MTTYGNKQRRDELREALQSVEAFELPENVQTAISNANVNASLDPALIQRYKDLRATFIQRNIQNSFLTYVNSYNGENFDEHPTAPTEEEEEELEQEMVQVRAEVAEASEGIHQQVLELQQKHNTFCLRRDELRNIVQDMDAEDAQQEKSENDPSVSNNDINIAMDEDSDEEVEDEALAKEEKRLAALQERKAKLMIQLRRLRQETSTLKVSAEQTEAKVAELLGGAEPPSPTNLHTETEETQKKIEEMKEMQSFYDGLRECMEELTGIQILEVSHLAKTSPEDETMVLEDGAKTTDESEIQGCRIRIKALQEHEIQITMRQNPENPEELRVSAAEILTSTEIRQTVGDMGQESTGEVDADQEDKKDVLVKIPPLDDLVRLCARFPPGEELRFLVRETLARIRMVQNRVVELAILHNNVLTNIGKFVHLEDGFGTQEQEVVCSLRECISVVLRLTADCPITPGSVYIHNLVGVAGWDEETVDKIKANVSKKEFQSPWALIQEIQAEIARLQDVEGFSLPKTPVLPLRRKK